MDGTIAIENNRQALLRVVAGLVAMTGWASAAPTSLLAARPTSPSAAQGAVAVGREKPQNRLFEQPSARSESEGPGKARRGEAETLAEPGEAGSTGKRKTISRHIRNAILLILRPAEAATRRLAIAMAGSLSPLPPIRLRKLPPKPKPEYVDISPKSVVHPGQRKTGVLLPRNALKRIGPDGTILAYLIPKPMPFIPAPPPKKRKPQKCARRAAFQLLDPLSNPMRRRRNYAPRHNQPRVWSPDSPRPVYVPSPSPRDLLDAAPLARRLALLTDALNDLPKQARRFQRWEMMRAAKKRREALTGVRSRPIRFSPLRPGRPPGARLAGYDPYAPRRKRIREIDEILAHAHDMALYALECPDTS